VEGELAGKQNIRISALHAAAPDDARALLHEMGKRVNPVESILTEISPVLGTHVGPGTVGLAYCKDL
jgi:fatty acid-binding protein DegV